MRADDRTTNWEPKPIDEAEILYDVAHARAGNKQDISNVTVVPYDDAIYEELVAILTPDRVRAHFAGIVTGEVERYCIENVCSMNFVMHGALDGGWTQSNRIDRSGKTLSTFMLRLPLHE
ncbi:AtuA-related protein [Natronorarus salvus]|uniref:AtuA-related protein n=1 Tax=Natronorarus salvus TaxID=3117733 RepID=UPI002F26234B